VQIQRLARAAQAERRLAARISFVAEVQVLIEHDKAAGPDGRSAGDPVSSQIVLAVAEEPAADVDGLIRRVVQFDPVGLPWLGVGHHLVDHHRAGRDRLGAVVEAR